MTDAISWVFVIGGVALIAAMVYDTCFRCRHEWEQHYFEKGGASRVCLICKKCGKVKVLK